QALHCVLLGRAGGDFHQGERPGGIVVGSREADDRQLSSQHRVRTRHLSPAVSFAQVAEGGNGTLPRLIVASPPWRLPEVVPDQRLARDAPPTNPVMVHIYPASTRIENTQIAAG